jgi:hypothetical protein
VAHDELQERNQQLRDSPPSRVTPEADMIHDARHPARHADQVLFENERFRQGNRSGREFHRGSGSLRLKGTYISTEPFHLFRYLDEQAFRYNDRAAKEQFVGDGDKFGLAMSRIVGKRLTFAETVHKILKLGVITRLILGE